VIAGPGPRVFACADGPYDARFARVGAAHAIDVALLPIGGFLGRAGSAVAT
jgi:L-ascorbate metabolism protein UlaG (beta-lactamase superfamily)